MSDKKLVSAQALLEAHGFKVEKAKEYVPPRHRCVRCGKRQDSTRYPEPYMTDVTVEIAGGEEGHTIITKYVCLENSCLNEMTDALMALGFKDHRHGGINFLEPQDCPGANDMDACPTPAKDEDDD